MVSCAKDATKFIVSVSFVAEVGSSYGCTPKPILAELGNPKKVEYTIKDGQVLVSNADPQ